MMNAGYKNPMITPVVLFGLFTLLAACSEMRPPAPQATESELTAQGVYPPYLTRYTLGERDANKKTLLNKERGFCWLSGVGGDAHGSFGVTQSGSSQTLSRTTAGAYVAAHCLEWGALKTNKVGAVKWLSPTFTAVTPVPASTCSTGSQTAWWGTSATFLTKLSGDWTDQGKIAFVMESQDGFKPSKVIAAGCDPSYFAMVAATSMFFGVPQTGGLPHYYGPNSSDAVRATVGTYGVKASKSLAFKVLAPADKAFCYLQSLSGQFDDDADIVELYVGGKNWILMVNNEGGKDNLVATAYCYRLTQ